MADAVTTVIENNGPRNLVATFTNFSDGTGENGVVKIDATSATYANRGVAPGIHLTINRIQYDIRNGGAVRVQWVANSNTDAIILTGFDDLDFRQSSGLINPNGTGATGSIAFTTVDFAAKSSYSITLWMRKNV